MTKPRMGIPASMQASSAALMAAQVTPPSDSSTVTLTSIKEPGIFSTMITDSRTLLIMEDISFVLLGEIEGEIFRQ